MVAWPAVHTHQSSHVTSALLAVVVTVTCIGYGMVHSLGGRNATCRTSAGAVISGWACVTIASLLGGMVDNGPGSSRPAFIKGTRWPRSRAGRPIIITKNRFRRAGTQPRASASNRVRGQRFVRHDPGRMVL